jgi:hypothetical protein
MNLLSFWVWCIALMLIAGVGFRIWHRPLPPVQLVKVRPEEAARMVRDFLVSATDGSFGFPSGSFALDTAATTDARIVAREKTTWDSHFVAILRRFVQAILGLASSFGCVGAVIGIFLVAVLVPLVLYAAFAELTLRFLLRSEIVARIAPLVDGVEGSQVSFILRGPSALLVGRQVERAFHPPALPQRLRAAAGLPTIQP